MAHIQNFGPRRRAPTLISTAPTLRGVPNIGAGLAQGLNALAQSRIAEADQAREAADSVDAAARVAQFQLDQGNALDEATKAYDGSEPGFQDAQLQAYDQAVERALSDAPERIQDRLEFRLSGSARASHGLTAATVENAATQAFTLRRVQGALDAQTNSILTSPAGFRPALESIPELAQGVPPVLRSQFMEDARNTLSGAYVSARLRSDPVGLVNELNGGELDDVLSPDTKNRFLNLAQSEIEQQARASAAARNHELRTRERVLGRQIGDAEDAAEAGFEPSTSFADLLSDADALGTEQGEVLAQRAAEGADIAEVSARLRHLPLVAVDRFVNEERQRLASGEATGAEARRLVAAETVFASMSTALNRDPVGFARRAGAEVADLDFTNANALAQSLSARVGQAQSIAQGYGVETRYFDRAELETLQAGIDQGRYSRLDVAAGIVREVGADAPAVLAEIAPNERMLAHVGGLVLSGATTAARDLNAGMELRARDGFQSRLPPRSRRQGTSSPLVSPLAQRLPKLAADLVTAADSIYEARAQREGWLAADQWSGSDGREQDYEQALQEAAGATFAPRGGLLGGTQRFGGITEYRRAAVLLPAWLSEDRFDDAVNMISRGEAGGARVFMEDGQGREIPADDLRRARFQSVDDRRYLVLFGDDPGAQAALNAGGEPYILDIDQYRGGLANAHPDWVR